MNLLILQAEDGTSARRYTEHALRRGDLVLFSHPHQAGLIVGVVACCIPEALISKSAQFGRIEAVLFPETPNTYEVTEFGTICIYNFRTPTELQATYWHDDLSLVRYAADAQAARDKLREEYTAEFFDRAEKQL